jgi:hypothetical protein
LYLLSSNDGIRRNNRNLSFKLVQDVPITDEVKAKTQVRQANKPGNIELTMSNSTERLLNPDRQARYAATDLSQVLYLPFPPTSR